MGISRGNVDAVAGEFASEGRGDNGASGIVGVLESVPRIFSVLSGSGFVPGVDAHDEGVDDMSPKSGDS